MATRRPKKKQNNNRSSKKSTEKESALSMGAHHRLGEGLLIFVGAVALYLLLALVSYHASDPSWSNTGNGVVANAGGRIGAWLADILLYAFGYPAYIFPILLAVLAWAVFRDKRVLHDGGWGIFSLRVTGFILVIVSACILSSLAFPNMDTSLPMNAGGIVGSLLGALLNDILSKIGTGLISFACLLVGLTLSAGLSWLTISKFLGKASLKLANYSRIGLLAITRYSAERISRWREARREAALNKPKLAIPEEPRQQSPVIAPPSAAPKPPPVAVPVVRETIQPPKPRPVAKKSSNVKNVGLQEGQLPPLSVLDQPQESKGPAYSREVLLSMSGDLERHLKHFGVDAKVVGVEPGPVVTRFEVELAPGMKVSKVNNIDKDLARSMSTSSVRVVEVIAGKSVIGLEVPNENRAFICLSEILSSETYQQSSAPLTMALGKDIAGHVMVTDLSKAPHLLVAGTTGSGKSVSLNAMLLSMLFKSTPKDLRLILIDPKMLELSIYQGIPHLLTPVVTDMREASNALRWCVAEMDRRYGLMASFGVRNLASLNKKIADAEAKGEPLSDPLISAEASEEARALTHLPNIVVLIDELADMMMVVGKKVEELIARIAQKARAAGIHMILATQRPSVDVITGLIKANIPSRIAFNVSSRIDSRTILDQQGAQQLLGHGDMLFLTSGSSVPVRVHGPFVSDDEIHRVVAALKETGEPDYLETILQDENTGAEGALGAGGAESDPLYDQAVVIVTETRRASISLVQRRLRIGYNRAANLLEAMEAAGVVSQMQSNGTREVLAPEPIKD